MTTNRQLFLQGDSLAPLLFCLAIDPLSKLLKSEGIGYSRKNKDALEELVSHGLMDDLQLYAASDEYLNCLIHVVHTFSK